MRSGSASMTTPQVYAARYAVEMEAAGPEADAAMEDGALELLLEVDGAAGEEAAAPEAEAAAEAAGPGGALSHWYSRGRGWRERLGRDSWTPLFLVECARLALFLQNCADLRKVCRNVARIVCPEKDLGNMEFPGTALTRDHIVKLDLLYMLSRRKLFEDSGTRRCRGLNPDSSPQLGFEFLCCVEELMERDLPISIPQEGFSPWAGSKWTRRALPTTTVARGRTGVATKVDRISHAATLET